MRVLLLPYPIYFAVGLNDVQIIFVLSGPNDPDREKRQVGPPMSSVNRRMRTVVVYETRIATKAYCVAAGTEKYLYKAVRWLT